jgi:hypothetical protein
MLFIMILPGALAGRTFSIGAGENANGYSFLLMIMIRLLIFQRQARIMSTIRIKSRRSQPAGL